MIHLHVCTILLMLSFKIIEFYSTSAIIIRFKEKWIWSNAQQTTYILLLYFWTKVCLDKVIDKYTKGSHVLKLKVFYTSLMHFQKVKTVERKVKLFIIFLHENIYSRLICKGDQVIPGNHWFQGITGSQIFERELMWFWNQWFQGITGSRESLVPHIWECYRWVFRLCKASFRNGLL